MSLMIKAQFTIQVYYDFNSISTDEVRRSVTKKSYSAIMKWLREVKFVNTQFRGFQSFIN